MVRRNLYLIRHMSAAATSHHGSLLFSKQGAWLEHTVSPGSVRKTETTLAIEGGSDRFETPKRQKEGSEETKE